MKMKIATQTIMNPKFGIPSVHIRQSVSVLLTMKCRSLLESGKPSTDRISLISDHYHMTITILPGA